MPPRHVLFLAVAAVLATTAASMAPRGAFAAAIDVLWYSYADPASEYRARISDIGAAAPGYPQSSGDSWNLSFWAPGDTTPDFSLYDVLVIESGEAWRTNPPGGALETPDFSGILVNGTAIAAARGDRTFISGSDADFHAVRGNTGHSIAPDLTEWDGALGYVVNAVNWAGTGRGLGIVSWYDGEFPGAFWWLNPQSFLRDELAGHVFQLNPDDETPAIPAAAAGHPVNRGLTSLGLSFWNNSFHAAFSLDVPGYLASVDNDAANPTRAVTLVSVAVSEPATIGFVSGGLAAIFFLFRRHCGPALETRLRSD